MKLSRLIPILSLVVTIPGAWSASLNANGTKLPENCPKIPAWHSKRCQGTVMQSLSWCAGAYLGGCCSYSKVKYYCPTDGTLSDILYVNVGYTPNTECHTSLDGTGDCVIPTSIAP